MSLNFLVLQMASFSSWDQRANQIYGSVTNAQEKEEVQESAIRIESFPVPYSYPFGPKFEDLEFIIQPYSTNT